MCTREFIGFYHLLVHKKLNGISFSVYLSEVGQGDEAITMYSLVYSHIRRSKVTDIQIGTHTCNIQVCTYVIACEHVC